MLPAVSTSATQSGYAAPTSDASVAVTATQSRASLTVVTAEGDRVTLSSGVNVEATAIGYDARGNIGGPDPTATPQSVSSPASVAGEYKTTNASLFAASRSGPSALPARSAANQIGAPPLARAIDLLRSMMLALRKDPAADRSETAPSPHARPSRHDGVAY